jgi:hypothetical protein
MKLEFLSEGSPDCPLIRLYSFTRPEAVRLKQIAVQLSTGELREIALQGEPGIDPVCGCQLLLRRGKRDQGIIQLAPLRFECALSDKGWLDVSFLLEPFCETDTTGFQWLIDNGTISLLISVKGTW